MLPSDDWEYFKEVPIVLTKFIEGTEEFSIAETIDGLRNLVMLDKHRWGKDFMLKSRGRLAKSSLRFVGSFVAVSWKMESW